MRFPGPIPRHFDSINPGWGSGSLFLTHAPGDSDSEASRAVLLRNCELLELFISISVVCRPAPTQPSKVKSSQEQEQIILMPEVLAFGPSTGIQQTLNKCGD